MITRSIARKYFHRDLPIGETLQVQVVDPEPPGALPRGSSRRGSCARAMMRRSPRCCRISPSNTNLTTEVFASGRSAYSSIARMEAHAGLDGGE